MSVYEEKERNQDFDFFIKNYDKLFKLYGHKFIAIKNKTVLGAYDNIVDAINITSETYPVGTFIIQECNGDESGYTNYISSWQLISV